ncbi:protein phosphatase 1 regulatory subunit 15B isoform X1 [Sander lucioperca]|nr:protein phosphatase 1 regulatory subunit 15B isoform X1 [Sander lucioperca]XP_031172067.2 protein phosphatase 1 regulatory subunit 15B isoform X1 [Sander lucioperca]
MFRTMSSERHGQSSSSPAGRGVSSAGLVNQESSWIGLLSRPAMTFLQSYLPGRPLRAQSRSDTGTGWNRGDLHLKNSFVDAESDFLRQLDDIMPLNVTHHPGPHVPVLRCQNAGAAGLLEPRAGGTIPWITADSLRELGIQSAEGMDLNSCHQQTHESGYLSSAWTSLSHVFISLISSQEIGPPAGKEWGPAGASVTGGMGKSRTWWDSFWGGEESSQRGLLYLPRAGTAQTLCPQQQPETSEEGWTLGENTGASQHKEESGNNGGLHTAQNTEWFGVREHWSRLGAEAAAACSVAVLLTPETDNGYSSPEEEHLQLCVQVCQLKMLSEDQQEHETENTGKGKETSEDGECDVTSGQEVEEEEEQEAAAPDASPEDPCAATPQCQNKAIAFIMGCPCSDDSQSDESSDEDDDDDDDGFDSEGLSDPSDSSDEEDEEDSDSEAESEPDSEAERLWRSLCHSVDPYNPRNFTAQLPTARTPPRTVPAASPPSSTQSSPASSPPSGADSWDDSASASEADEAESLRLLNSFGCSSDPYSPFNFQAPLRTRGPAGARPGTRARAQTSCRSTGRRDAVSPPEYRTEEAEERLDSGFSDLSTQSCSVTKKVRFCDDVEEFFASGGEEDEDRRGPWEELARDRCRFLRRCRDTEQSIAYVLQPQHRRRVWRRLAAAAARNVLNA